jgi:hypothetical protein
MYSKYKYNVSCVDQGHSSQRGTKHDYQHSPGMGLKTCANNLPPAINFFGREKRNQRKRIHNTQPTSARNEQQTGKEINITRYMQDITNVF